MDTAGHIRSFQDDGITYDLMLDTVTEEYRGSAFVMTAGQGSTIPGFVLQYNETDWEFAKPCSFPARMCPLIFNVPWRPNAWLPLISR